VYFANFVGQTGVIKYPFSGGRFAGVDVSGDTDVPG
jgi:hypothetical protein